MSKYAAYVLVSATGATWPQRVFLLKQEEGESAVESEKLRALRLDLVGKHGYDVLAVDMEVLEFKDLYAQIKKSIPKRKRT